MLIAVLIDGTILVAETLSELTAGVVAAREA